MRSGLKAILVSAAVLFVASATNLSAQQSSDNLTIDSYGDFVGRWEGKFTRVPTTSFDKSPNTDAVTELAIEISPSGVKVFNKLNARWQEFSDRKYYVAFYKTNAVIYGIGADLGSPADPGGWVETWNFTVTKKDRDHLYAFMTRAVNNFSHPYDYTDSQGRITGRFIHILYGEMSRPATDAK